MTTLKNIIDDILLNIRGGQISQSDKISRNQVAQWVNQYRQLIIKRDIDRDREIPDVYIQTVPQMKLNLVQNSSTQNGSSKKSILESEEQLPKLMVLNNRPALLSVSDIYGNIIQVGSKSRANYQQYRRYTCNDYIAYYYNGKLRIEGPNQLDVVDVQLIAEDPSDIDSCGFENGAYPLPEDKIPVLKNMIYAQEFGIRQNSQTDSRTNSRDDAQNGMRDTINTRQLQQVGSNLQGDEQ